MLDGCCGSGGRAAGSAPAGLTTTWRCRFAMSKTPSGPSAYSGAFRFLLKRFRARDRYGQRSSALVGRVRRVDRGLRSCGRSGRRAVGQRHRRHGVGHAGRPALLAAEILRLMRGHAGKYAANDAASVADILDDIEAAFNVARGPRLARQKK